MRLAIWIAILGIFFLIGWVYLSNIVGEVMYLYEDFGDGSDQLSTPIEDGTNVDIGVSQNVAVSVKRERWYGTIYEEYNGKRNLNILYLFDYIKLTTNVNNISFILLHWLFFSVVILLFFIVDIYSLRKGGNNEQKVFI